VNCSRHTYWQRVLVLLIALTTVQTGLAATRRVPQDHDSIQAAIAAAEQGDTILVAPGKYRERVQLKPGIVLRSEGDDSRARSQGLQRAELTVLDGGEQAQNAPGVVMAEGSTLDGFTITNVGRYDEDQWRKHHESQGEELGDDEGSIQAEGSIPAIRISSVNCTVVNCLIHHNGDVGIGILGKIKTGAAPLVASNFVYRNMGGGIGIADGAEPLVRGNHCYENLRAGIGCRQANPILTDNVCFQNIRAGIGCREGSSPVMRGNQCYGNRRSGIGLRMVGTNPIVEGNACYENDMAGIGCRDGAGPIIRKNVCRKNRLAGIGCSAGAKPLVVNNDCRENQTAGIGLQSQAAAIIEGNLCIDNHFVGIGITEGSSATVSGNQLSRQGGQPPMIAVKDGSTATIRDNRISGGGVAAVLVQGQATLSGNIFTGMDQKQGNAVWIWEKSTATITDNTFNGYRSAVLAIKSTVLLSGNQVTNFRGTAFTIKDSPQPSHAYKNTATSADPKAKVIELEGLSGIVDENVLMKE